MATADTVHGGRRAPLPPSLALLLATLLLALPLAAAARRAQHAPFGDRLTLHPAVRLAGDTGAPRLRLAPGGLEAYAPDTGALRWTYAREGHRPLQALPAHGEAVALWDDGLVTGTSLHRGALSVWHRGVPGWLAAPAARHAHGALQLLGPRPDTVAVVTPRLVTAYGSDSGDLRWHREAGPGCAFDSARTARRAGFLLIARHCAPGTPWTTGIAAVSAAGPFA
ncbi:hypothetical protein [Streptomyces sp. NPDC008001]|uniref:hypothetical protein n=1 Tax=Streptomyces sp. NPDC008001 TaxID=3364804 RepID=UPI0036ED62D2